MTEKPLIRRLTEGADSGDCDRGYSALMGDADQDAARAGALPMTPPTRFTSADFDAMANAAVWPSRSRMIAMLSQASADAERVEQFRAYLVKELEQYAGDYPSPDREVTESILAEFDRLLAERGGEEG